MVVEQAEPATPSAFVCLRPELALWKVPLGTGAVAHTSNGSSSHCHFPGVFIIPDGGGVGKALWGAL